MAKRRQRRLLLRLATLLLSQLPRARRIKRSLPLRVLARSFVLRATPLQAKKLCESRRLLSAEL